jgi:hypothetical protein
MGTDIHVMMELSWNGHAYHEFVPHLLPLNRNYYLFSVLAGVRKMPGDFVISAPRGLPTNASKCAIKLFEDTDYHSHSWIVRSEWESLAQNIEPSLDYLFKYVNHVYDTFHTRMLFAFDN